MSLTPLVPRIARIPKLKRREVTRAEFNHLVDVLNERAVVLNDIQAALEVQFTRIAQLQAELDEVRRTSQQRPRPVKRS
jgi:hypothetical protein